jgi:predicted HicB family RNase H-like nuclease
LRIKPSLKTALGDLARADAKTLNFYIERVLDAHIEAK